MLAQARILILSVTLALGVGACHSGGSGRSVAESGAPVAATGTPVVILHAGAGGRSIPVRVELALNEPQRERGLMYRNHMDPDAGMLFLFPSPAPLTFWMKNTLIPLDMIFIDQDRHILGIVENAVPETETARRVTGNSQYVLEIGGGLSQKWGVVPGSTVDFQGSAATATPN
ncbi:MAG TPA: DUF192 domain-containing protein [Polyangia bacterium]|jgi:hypothetical protein